MMTPEGAQRVLDYRVFGHNFKKFPEYLERFEKSYEEYRVIYAEDTRNPSLKGQGIYFKHRRIKLNRWHRNYLQLWEQYFAVICIKGLRKKLNVITIFCNYPKIWVATKSSDFG